MTGPSAPGPLSNGVAVVLGTTYNPPLSALYVGTSGSLVAVMNNGTVTLPNVPVGFVTSMVISQVGTASSASNITGFF